MIRLAQLKDIDILNEMVLKARDYMHSHGNPTQWAGLYPNRDDLEYYIKKRMMYVIEIHDEIEFGFVYTEKGEPTYSYIEGSWLNDEIYGVFHLVVSRMRMSHLGDQMIQFGKNRIDNLRIDTHENNTSMQKLLARNGFQYTGIIYVHDGSPRKAYQWCRNLF